MKRFTRRVATLATCGVLAGGALIGAATATGPEASAEPGVHQAAQYVPPQSFPYLYSNTRWAQLWDHPLNSHVWDHGTVLTHGQTVTLRDSGVLPVVAGSAIVPWSSRAQTTMKMLTTNSKVVAAGGCLALFWDDAPFRGAHGESVQTGYQVLPRQMCRP